MKYVKNIGITLGIPVGVYLLFWLLCSITGNTIFASTSNFLNIVYMTVYSALVALAMHVNLTAGRLDFSIGATMILAIILGGNIAKEFGMGAAGMLIITVVIGTVIGFVSGMAYVLLRIPPMVVSLGLAMGYEAIGFMFNGSKGVKLIGRSSMLIFSKFPNNIIIIAVVLVVLILLFEHTNFGYNRKALERGQKISGDSGIKEKKNAVACYMLAGALLGIAGCVYISKYGTVTPETGLSSSSFFITAFLPFFIGEAIGKYSFPPLAVFIGAFVQSCITSGLANMNAGYSVQTIINGIVVMIFLIYSANGDKLVEARMLRDTLEKIRREHGIDEG